MECKKDHNTPHLDRSECSSLQDAEQLRLLWCARDGDEEAFSELMKTYAPMLGSAVHQYRGEINEQDIEELNQEALLAFHRAVQRYDPLRGDVKFGLYAKVCVNKAMISALRRITRNRQRIEYVPMVDDRGDGAPSPAESVIEREDERSLRRLINNNLSDLERRVWWLYYSGAGADEIARITGKPKKSIDNAIFRVRKKLRAILSEKGHRPNHI